MRNRKEATGGVDAGGWSPRRAPKPRRRWKKLESSANADLDIGRNNRTMSLSFSSLPGAGSFCAGARHPRRAPEMPLGGARKRNSQKMSPSSRGGSKPAPNPSSPQRTSTSDAERESRRARPRGALPPPAYVAPRRREARRTPEEGCGRRGNGHCASDARRVPVCRFASRGGRAAESRIPTRDPLSARGGGPRRHWGVGAAAAAASDV